MYRIIAGAVFVILLILAAISWFFLADIRRWTHRKSLPTDTAMSPAPPTPAVSGLSGVSPSSSVTAVSNAPAVTQFRPTQLESPTITASGQGDVSRLALAGNANTQATSAAMGTPPPESVLTASNVPKRLILPDPIEWPVVTITGVLNMQGGKGSVLINNQLVMIGEAIQNIKVVAISKQMVTLAYRGEIRQVKVGESTR